MGAKLFLGDRKMDKQTWWSKLSLFTILWTRLKTTGRYIISNVRIRKNHNTLQNFIPAFTSNTIEKYGIPIIKAEYYLMFYRFWGYQQFQGNSVEILNLLLNRNVPLRQTLPWNTKTLYYMTNIVSRFESARLLYLRRPTLPIILLRSGISAVSDEQYFCQLN